MELDGAFLAGSYGASPMKKFRETAEIEAVAIAADCFLVGAFLGLTAVAACIFLVAYLRERVEP